METFLSHFPNHLIATLDDKASKGAEPKREPLPHLVSNQRRREWITSELKALNEQGAGIFFAYNQLGEIRNKASVKGINAWVMEIDNISKEEQYEKILNCPMPPSVMVETKNSYHCYWMADENAKVENASKINTALQQYFNSDPAMKDIARLLRVPNFYHNKKEPYMVEVVKDDYDCIFSEEEMLKYYPYKEPEVKIPKWKPANGGNFWEAVNQIHCMTALERLSGTAIVNGEIYSFKARTGGGYYILVNGEPCNAWIDNNGMIGSGSGGGPTIVNWLQHDSYSVTDKEIAEWIKSNCSDLLPASVLNERSPKPYTGVESGLPVTAKLKPKAKPSGTIWQQNWSFKRYTWGTPNLDKVFGVLHPQYLTVLYGSRGQGKTTYIYDMIDKNVKLGHKVLFFSLEQAKNELFDNLSRNYAGITNEEKHRWNGTESNAKIDAYHRKYEELSSECSYFVTQEDMGGRTWEKLKEEILSHEELDLIVIDNLDFVAGRDGEHNNNKQIRIIQDMHDFCLEYRVPIILLHHQRKYSANGKSAGMDDMAGSGKVADTAHNVIKVVRDTSPSLVAPDKYRTGLIFEKARCATIEAEDIFFNAGTFDDIYKGKIEGVPDLEQTEAPF